MNIIIINILLTTLHDLCMIYLWFMYAIFYMQAHLFFKKYFNNYKRKMLKSEWSLPYASVTLKVEFAALIANATAVSLVGLLSCITNSPQIDPELKK